MLWFLGMKGQRSVPQGAIVESRDVGMRMKGFAAGRYCRRSSSIVQHNTTGLEAFGNCLYEQMSRDTIGMLEAIIFEDGWGRCSVYLLLGTSRTRQSKVQAVPLDIIEGLLEDSEQRNVWSDRYASLFNAS